MQNPSQEPPASSKTQNQDLKDMGILCTFKIKIDSQNLEHRCFKDQLSFPNKDQNQNPSQEPLASSKAPNEDLKGHGCSLHLQNQD